MFISFSAIRSELSSLASSMKNDVLSDNLSKSMAKPVSVVNLSPNFFDKLRLNVLLLT